MIDHCYLFSYNRGEFLKNLIDSIEKNISNCSITIVDDGSTDLKTINFLEEIKIKHRVINPHTKKTKGLKYGNLYNNKNWAINDAKVNGFKYVNFFPEDVQIVRNFSDKDFERVEIAFDKNTNTFQCLCLFVEKVYKFSGLQNLISYDSECGYFVKNQQHNSKRLSYSDFGLINVDKFFTLFEKFEDSEYLSDKKAHELNLTILYDGFPHLAILPFNTYHRVAGNDKLTSLINQISQTGFYPYDFMSNKQIKQLFSRKVETLAFAEDWLNCSNVPNNNLWSFWGGFFSLEVYGNERKKLSHCLQIIKDSNMDEASKHRLMINECEKFLDNNDTPNSKNTPFIYY